MKSNWIATVQKDVVVGGGCSNCCASTQHNLLLCGCLKWVSCSCFISFFLWGPRLLMVFSWILETNYSKQTMNGVDGRKYSRWWGIGFSFLAELLFLFFLLSFAALSFLYSQTHNKRIKEQHKCAMRIDRIQQTKSKGEAHKHTAVTQPLAHSSLAIRGYYYY